MISIPYRTSSSVAHAGAFYITPTANTETIDRTVWVSYTPGGDPISSAARAITARAPVIKWQMSPVITRSVIQLPLDTLIYVNIEVTTSYEVDTYFSVYDNTMAPNTNRYADILIQDEETYY